jgi:hypothetical protein
MAIVVRAAEAQLTQYELITLPQQSIKEKPRYTYSATTRHLTSRSHRVYVRTSVTKYTVFLLHAFIKEAFFIPLAMVFTPCAGKVASNPSVCSTCERLYF